MLELARHRPIHYGPRRHVKAIRERLAALRFEHFEAIPQSPCLGAGACS